MILGGIITAIGFVVLGLGTAKNAIEINHLPRYSYVFAEANNEYHIRLALIAIIIMFGASIFIWGMLSDKKLVKQLLS